MYQEFIFKPLYNGLVLLMSIPGIDIGIAVILFTIIVRIILYPLSKSALITQIRMKEIEPQIAKIKADYSDNKQVQAMKMMEVYKINKVRPFAGVLLMLIQLPILFALIQIFYKVIPTVQADLLYSSFVHVPTISATFLGIDMTVKSLSLAILVGITQFLQLHFSLVSIQARKASKEGVKSSDGMANMALSMNNQMKYIMPIFAFASVYWIIPSQFPQAASIIALYWATTSLFTLGQELMIRRRYEMKKKL